MVKYNSTEPLSLEVGGAGVVGHAGLWQLGRFIDKLGVGERWSQAFDPPGRGRMLVQAASMLTGRGEAGTGIKYLGLSPGRSAARRRTRPRTGLVVSVSEETVRRLATP